MSSKVEMCPPTYPLWITDKVPPGAMVRSYFNYELERWIYSYYDKYKERWIGVGGSKMSDTIDDNVQTPKLAEQVGKAKDDSGKVDLSYLGDFGLALTEVARVCQAGNKKYTELTGKDARSSWRNVPNGFIRYTAALLRHYFKSVDEEGDGDLDKWEKDITHDAQIAWNALARLELKLRGLK